MDLAKFFEDVKGEIQISALEDNVISDDEHELLKILDNWFQKLEAEITPVMKEVQFSSEFDLKNRVITLIKDILPSMMEQAEADGKISVDEVKLLGYIQRL